MAHEYLGYLKQLLDQPDPAASEQAASVAFGPRDLSQWHTRDLPYEMEWHDIPAHRTRSDDSVSLVGRFEDVRRIDSLPADRPAFWVPLSSLGWKDERFPIDLTTYPVLELTYRCGSDNTMPKLAWTYPGGFHLFPLPPTRSWRTVVLQIPHFGFPEHLDALIVRLYSPSRTTETLDIQTVRFRALTPAEAEALDKDNVRLSEHPAAKHYSALDEFLPLGVTMNAATARRLAEMLGIALPEYWGLALEDIAAHHHNCIAFESVSQLTSAEWSDFLAAADSFDIKVVVVHDSPHSESLEDWEEIIQNRIIPYADSSTILAWGLRRNPSETEFQDLLEARKRIEAVDPNHPLCITTQFPCALPLYAPHFAVAGFSFFASKDPWGLGRMVQAHIPLAAGQQFWLEAPTFIYATGAPEWCSCPEMRLMVNLGFANGARGWFNHSYHNDPIWAGGTLRRSLTGPFLAFSDLWSELNNSMERYNAVAPMILHAEPVPLPSKWYVTSQVSGENVLLPEGVPPTSSFRLQGNDYNLYFVVSNDIRGTIALHANIPEDSVKGLALHDITDFVRSRKWVPMDCERHVEMFPGEVRIVLTAPPNVCDFWRDAIASRLIEDDRRRIGFHLNMARVYDLDVADVEGLIEKAGEGADVMKLEIMDRARDMLMDVLYNAPAVAQARSGIIDASAAVCACDGALCRLVGRGKAAVAQDWGLKVIPLAREFTNLRLDLRRGRGADVLAQSRDVAERALQLLGEIRALLEPVPQRTTPVRFPPML